MNKKERPLIPGHLGLDLAKDKFDAAVLTAPGALHHQSFERTAGGLAALRRWLRALEVQVAAVVMEATDLYFELPAQKLHAAGFASLARPPAFPSPLRRLGGQSRPSRTLCPGAAHARQE